MNLFISRNYQASCQLADRYFQWRIDENFFIDDEGEKVRALGSGMNLNGMRLEKVYLVNGWVEGRSASDCNQINRAIELENPRLINVSESVLRADSSLYSFRVGTIPIFKNCSVVDLTTT